MPELPDVETYRRLVTRHALRQVIVRSSIRDAGVLDRTPVPRIHRALRGRRFVGTHRHGKYLFLRLNDDGWMVLHFGMTGRLRYYGNREPEPQFTIMVISFDNGHQLAYTSRRKLGIVDMTDAPRIYVKRRGLGIDALGLDEPTFMALLTGHRAAVKNFLMDQHRLSGLGNVYTDEILFHAGIHPKAPVDKLNQADRRRLFRSLRSVLDNSIRAQAHVIRLPRTFLLPHRHKGGRCPRCGTPLKRLTTAGRTAYYCPRHQRPWGSSATP